MDGGCDNFTATKHNEPTLLMGAFAPFIDHSRALAAPHSVPLASLRESSPGAEGMDVPHLTEDEMAEIKKDVLNRLRHYLCDKIRAERHLDFLRSRRILTRDDAEEICGNPTQTRRTSVMLDYLAENPRGLDALIDSIREMRAQNFIVAKITDEVQRAKNEKMESLRAGASSSTADDDLSSPSANNDLSTFSPGSTLLFHPDGERSPSTLDVAASLNLPSCQRGGGDLPATSFSTASSLPRPGDPGAPPLPDEAAAESPSVMDDAASGCSSGGGSGGSSGGGNLSFQPLRSRSLTPTSQRNIF